MRFLKVTPNPETNSMKIIASTSAFKDDLDHALETLARLGFEEVDLIAIGSWGLVSVEALVEDFDAELARVQGLLSKHGLRAVSMNTAFSPQLFDREDAAQNEARREQVRAVCRFMKAMEIPLAAHYPGHIADWKNDPEGVWKGTVKSLREIQSISKEFGVTLAPEIHFKTPFEAPADARRLLGEIPGLPYTYEPSHFIVNGVDYTTTVDLLEGAKHCHLRTSGEGQIQCAAADNFEPLDWMMSKLKERNYTGIVSIEYLPGADFDVEASIAALRVRYAR